MKYAPAAEPGSTGCAAGSAIIVAMVFMIPFLFTVVNAQYGMLRFIEPDLASGFAAIPVPAGY